MYKFHPFWYSLFFYQAQNTLSFGPSISQSKACFPHFKVSKIIETFIRFPKPGALSFCSMNTTPPAHPHTQAHKPTLCTLTFTTSLFQSLRFQPLCQSWQRLWSVPWGWPWASWAYWWAPSSSSKACTQVGPPDTRVPCESHPRKEGKDSYLSVPQTHFRRKRSGKKL